MQRQDELMLSEAFQEGVGQVRKGMGPGTPLHIINFDWHGMMRDLKEKQTVLCLWEHLTALLPRSDLSAGTMEPAPSDADTPQRSVYMPFYTCCMRLVLKIDSRLTLYKSTILVAVHVACF